MARIVILDYGVGNLFSLACAIEAEGATAVVSQGIPSDLSLDGLILPGVGNFAPVAAELQQMRDQIHRVVESGRPILGVCLGMQILFESSEEGPGEGLGLIPGRVVKLPPTVKTPHMGWNNLKPVQANPLVDSVPDDAWVYFVHSFYPQPEDERVVVARADYGISFPAIVACDNIYGAQFHPEKSGEAGRAVLKNFLRLCQS
ncbi:MAG: imidazole glycerol phosphate synthase subunit HisH [Acidobacteria bacterium]|nr:imidazole glycerol phosphate synthase subunit HisH [Acidobacteriota bacterium]